MFGGENIFRGECSRSGLGSTFKHLGEVIKKSKSVGFSLPSSRLALTLQAIIQKALHNERFPPCFPCRVCHASPAVHHARAPPSPRWRGVLLGGGALPHRRGAHPRTSRPRMPRRRTSALLRRGVPPHRPAAVAHGPRAVARNIRLVVGCCGHHFLLFPSPLPRGDTRLAGCLGRSPAPPARYAASVSAGSSRTASMTLPPSAGPVLSFP